jgi:two-component system, LytTR family, response regulator
MKYKFENVRAIKEANILPSDIIYIQADFNYTIFHLQSGKKMTLAKTLWECEQMLEDEPFVRPNRSTLINLSFLKDIEDNALTLGKHLKTSISRRRKELLLSRINTLNIAI